LLSFRSAQSLNTQRGWENSVASVSDISPAGKPRVKQAKPPFCSRKREPAEISRICESVMTTLQNQPRFKSARRLENVRTHLEADSQRETGSGATGLASPISL